MSRRHLPVLLFLVLLFALGRATVSAVEPDLVGPFGQRGCYMTFMRMPTYGLDAWTQILDCIREDGGNTLLLWIGGAFRSKRYPVTWRYNQDHENVRGDFVRELIDAAHRRGIQVILALTPFGYDGVNQYGLEHPELKARKADGSPVDEFGIHCWGWNLCPSRSESLDFMLGYTRELLFEFYPNADGLMLESSDYSICRCMQCQGHYFEREFRFVKQISDELWARRPNSQIVVYPHYFSGRKVAFTDAQAASETIDPRWTLFFTPHSAHVEPNLIRRTRRSIWWNEGHAFLDPRALERGAKQARDAGCTGYLPSMEAFTYRPTHIEEGQPWLVGRQQVPLGFGWLDSKTPPYRELPARVTRLAYREFARRPGLNWDEFRITLGRELLGGTASAQVVDDILELQKIFSTERNWSTPPPLTAPGLVEARLDQGKLGAGQRAELRRQLQFAKTLSETYAKPRNDGERSLRSIAEWLVNLWAGNAAKRLLESQEN